MHARLTVPTFNPFSMIRSQDCITYPSGTKVAFQPRLLTYPDNGDELCERVFGFKPKVEQRQVAEHIGRGEDCILIAGCGWGKTLAYFLPLVLWEGRVVVVISPLVALMEEQHGKLQETNISSIPLNSGRQPPHNLEQELISGKYRAVFLSPETAFNNVRFGMLWNEDGWRSKVQAVVIDEAHCISTWGSDFRKDYSRIGELRSIIPPGIAFVAVSATLHGDILQDVKRSLHFDNTVKVIKADTDRPNIRYEVQVTNGSIDSCFEALEAYMDSKKTLVYFDKGSDMTGAYLHLSTIIRSSGLGSTFQLSDIVMYYADLATETKRLYMSKFKQGKIKMMLSTEAAGMGCDLSDIERVVQFRFPKNITALAQRLGRAARSPKVSGVGILLYPRADAQLLRTMEADLRDYILTDCRRRHFNRVFENKHKVVLNCCDLCGIIPSTTTPDYKMVRKNPRPPLSRPFKTTRSQEQQHEAKARILAWRKVELEQLNMQAEFYDESCLMNNGTINLLSARFGDIATADDINAVVDWSELVQGSQKRLADTLAEYNKEIDSLSSLNNVSSLPCRRSRPAKRAGDPLHWNSERHLNKRSQRKRK